MKLLENPAFLVNIYGVLWMTGFPAAAFFQICTVIAKKQGKEQQEKRFRKIARICLLIAFVAVIGGVFAFMLSFTEATR